MVGLAISTAPKRPIVRRWKNMKPYAVRTPRVTSAWSSRGCTTTWATSTVANRIRRKPRTSIDKPWHFWRKRHRRRPQPDLRFELARTYYLLGRAPDRSANPGLPEGANPPPRARRRPGHRPPPDAESPPPDGGPPDDREPMGRPSASRRGHPEDLQRAIAILDPLVKEDPKNPANRYLLAQCYREEAGSESGPLPPIDKAQELLKTLVHDYPQVADYRFELADTCAMLDVRDLPPDDFPQAERRLRAALEQSADLVDGHPYAPDYISLHIHILHKLARILRDTPPERRESDVARMDEAGQLYQEAIRRQAGLVKRFPDNAAYRYWLGMIRTSSAAFLLERRQPAEARNVLETAVAETEKYFQAHPECHVVTTRAARTLCRGSSKRDAVWTTTKAPAKPGRRRSNSGRRYPSTRGRRSARPSRSAAPAPQRPRAWRSPARPRGISQSATFLSNLVSLPVSARRRQKFLKNDKSSIFTTCQKRHWKTIIGSCKGH